MTIKGKTIQKRTTRKSVRAQPAGLGMRFRGTAPVSDDVKYIAGPKCATMPVSGLERVLTPSRTEKVSLKTTKRSGKL